MSAIQHYGKRLTIDEPSWYVLVVFVKRWVLP